MKRATIHPALRPYRWRALVIVALLVPLLACGPLSVFGSSTSGTTLRGSVPTPWDDLPPGAPCRIAAAFAASVDGLIYSWGGAAPANDPLDPRTGTYYGRTGPDSYDCSGMTQVAYAQAGVQIGLTTIDQVHDGTPVPCTPADLHGAATTCWATGDLVVFLDAAGTAQHVEMYVRDGIFAACLNWQENCRVWERAPDSFPPRYAVRRIVNDCVQQVQHLVVDGSWRGQGVRAAMTAMGLGDAAITNHFNSADAAGGARHGGTDFAITAGTPLYALFGGTVIEDGFTSINGNYIVIESLSGQRAYYGHRMERTGLAGQTVRAGDPIGHVGYTGLVLPAGPAGAHVHFQITGDDGGAWIDPETYFGPDAPQVWSERDPLVLRHQVPMWARAA